MRIAIIGTGALGGYYGACFERAGHEVHFLARSDVKTIQSSGLRVASPTGDMLLHPCRVYDDPRQMPACDVVCLCTKTTANGALSTLLPESLFEPDGFALILQNGLGVEADVADIIGDERVVGGLCFLCANKIGPGEIRHLDYGRIIVGEYRADGVAAGMTPRLETIVKAIQDGGNEAAAAEDLNLARWKKLVWNIPFNGLSVVLNATTAAMLQDPKIAALARALMGEVQAAAAAHGLTIEDAFIDKMMVDTHKMEPYATSMKLDYDARRPMEVETMFHRPVAAALGKGCPVPRIATLAAQVGYLNAR